MRAQAFQLFGNLSRFGDGPSLTPFLEQIHSNFISLLLHLNDTDVEVKKVSNLFFNSFLPANEDSSLWKKPSNLPRMKNLRYSFMTLPVSMQPLM